MTYEIAEAMGVDVTYGWLIAQVTSGGPADEANLQGGTQQVTVAGQTVMIGGDKGGTQQVTVAGQTVMIGGDIVIALNGIRITGIDNLSTFLEEHTLPDQTIDVTIIRNGQTLTLQLKLGARPPPT